MFDNKHFFRFFSRLKLGNSKRQILSNELFSRKMFFLSMKNIESIIIVDRPQFHVDPLFFLFFNYLFYYFFFLRQLPPEVHAAAPPRPLQHAGPGPLRWGTERLPLGRPSQWLRGGVWGRGAVRGGVPGAGDQREMCSVHQEANEGLCSRDLLN